MKKNYLLFISFSFITFVNAQNVSVSKKVYINDSESYNSALEKGLRDAKIEALRMAGVTEYISEYTRLLTSEVNENINEVFTSDLLIHLGGSIKEWEYINTPEKKFDTENNSWFVEFKIKAKVRKYKSKPDPKFKTKIEGLKGSYNDGDRIEFSVSPYQDSYLKIFYISGHEANILFPYKKSQELLIKGYQNEIIDYLIAEGGGGYESGRLIIVITKENYPFDATQKDDQGYEIITSVDDIFKWLLDIEPQNRTEYYHQFIISN